MIFLLERIITNLDSVTGRNVKYVMDETGYDDIFAMKVEKIKESFQFCEIEENNRWKIDFVKEIVDVKQNVLELDQNVMTDEELEEILVYLTTS